MAKKITKCVNCKELFMAIRNKWSNNYKCRMIRCNYYVCDKCVYCKLHSELDNIHIQIDKRIQNKKIMNSIDLQFNNEELIQLHTLMTNIKNQIKTNFDYLDRDSKSIVLDYL